MADDDLTQFTPAGAERLRAAAAELAAAVTAHADAVAAVTGEAGMPEVFAASDRLLPAVLAYADAQFDLTGNDFPFGVLHSYAEDDEQDDDEAVPDDGAADPGEDDAPGAATEVAVLQRHDLLVTDAAAVLAAGRRARSRTAPDGDETVDAEGADLGRALSQLAAADGWDSLGDVPGLRSTGRSVLVVGREVPAGVDDPADLVECDDGELLFSQQDVFPG
ncbi:hypothetical protein [Modestobacter italicus]|uniref:hypothetical protein n=1 Tax=Modestobacter italicus (strain DSM 44449 / CECT 9708 / BC 501) TaxID=2732864 RepID=UPI001C97AF53|nr:hypothetical protein [Modestobacter italicus]